MVRRSSLVALLALVGCGMAAAGADAKGLEMGARNGVTVAGSPYRYVAITTHATPKHTAIERIDRRGGRIDRWWQLRGEYDVPAVAYDGTGGGLAANGRTLVLSRFAWGYPPKATRLAILDTDLRPWRGPGLGRSHQPMDYVDLPGHYTFDAISPDGSTIYLIHYLHHLSREAASAYLAPYEVRAFDAESHRLFPEPIVDPEEPGERMEGLPLSRATSPDGRWAYTLYDGGRTFDDDVDHEPFIHALDTVERRAVCIDLPQLADLHSRFFYLLQLQIRQGGQELVLLRRRPGPPPTRALLSVDTRSFEVGGPDPPATASSGIGPWPPIAALAAAALLVTWMGVRRRRVGASAEPPKRA